MLQRVLPAARWLRSYRREDLGGDISAGLTTAVMLIPQGMAYAMLAGLPPIVGLYASVLPLAVYALFGSSRQLAVGPVAMVSMLVLASAGAIAEPGSAQFISYAVMLALMVGVLQLAMGVLRLGFLTNFLSHPVVSGFTSAAALIIFFSQLKHLLGVPVARSHHVNVIAAAVVSQLANVSVPTLIIGVLTIVALVALKRYAPRAPRALIVVVLGTVAVWLLGLADKGVAIVGTVPAGLPSLSLPPLDWAAMRKLAPIAITITLVGFMESISVAKAVARRHGYEVDANQELVGLGLANLAASLTGAYPVAGGFGRSAVNDQAGANTPLASLITAAVMGVSLLLFTPLFYYLPKAVLAAIIMVAVAGLVDLSEVKHLWRVKRSDLVLLLLTFGATLTLGIEEGIAVGVGASLLWFVVRTTRPHTAVLGQLPGKEIYRNVANFSEARPVPGALIVRVDAQFYFGNVTFLKATLSKLEAKVPRLRSVILDASSINQLDSSAATALCEIATDYRARGVRLMFANVKHPVREVMRRTGLVDRLGIDSGHLRVHDAVVAHLESQNNDDDGDTPSESPRAAEASERPIVPARAAAHDRANVPCAEPEPARA
ncbi:MAG: solute carrier family 26 protein [Myxococcales bacterium]|nr:solute carrier family 26 protein [Myxococcales bacterium]